ncbi:RNA polymerase sigma factor [Falsibacillus pallidus]|uniref:RNA polymerase sigma-70 factor (ECF subfamily) n=1 Tax=Falsibacillus pallidus TaxID=493781 RepID=A0A370GQX8_9BACI|nr:RNA polymerase sigma factor [Falsibacillus pallidus]RDI45656.1 RNA polymerase sigma-70 factor (ECF subfamily) [Falsibacillus pallidus]
MSIQKIESWFHDYHQDIYNFLIYYVGSTDVEDMLQEVFIRALKGIHTFRGDSNPKTWLFSIARNIAVDVKRKEKSDFQKVSALQNQIDVGNVHAATPEEAFELDQRKSELIAAIRTLKQNYQDVIFLRALKEFSIEETAEILGWKTNKVSVTYHRAIKTLRDHLIEKGGYPEWIDL